MAFLNILKQLQVQFSAVLTSIYLNFIKKVAISFTILRSKCWWSVFKKAAFCAIKHLIHITTIPNTLIITFLVIYSGYSWYYLTFILYIPLYSHFHPFDGFLLLNNAICVIGVTWIAFFLMISILSRVWLTFIFTLFLKFTFRSYSTLFVVTSDTSHLFLPLHHYTIFFILILDLICLSFHPSLSVLL